MNPPVSFFQRIFSLLQVRPIIGGLEVSDQVLRLAYFDGRMWQLHAVRLAPGTLEDGKVKDRPAFIAALSELKAGAKIGGRDRKKMVSVVVALSSVSAYSKVFTLPMVGGENFEKAVALNLEMISPNEMSQVYAGWQVVGKNDAIHESEILAGFVDRALVNDVVGSLLAAGFIAVAVESRPLALTRVLREKGSGIEPGKSYLLVNLDNNGLDFLVVRNRQLYFEYSRPWRDVADGKGEISLPAFRDELVASLRQVSNFYRQHWPEPIGAVIVAASSFQDEVGAAVADNFSMPAASLTLEMGQPISSEWLIALGASLRGAEFDAFSKEISFLGDELADRFRGMQVINFLKFWQVLVPASLGILVLFFAVAGVFAQRTEMATQTELTFNADPRQAAEVSALEASSTDFNALVAMVQQTEAEPHPASGMLGRLQDLAAQDGVTISHLSFTGSAAPVSLAALAPSEDRILAFKAALAADPDFSDVTLPVTGVQQNGDTFSFTISFWYIGK
ncbi:MAG TPA: PilN domain-containing protein [Candidatus Paceibacterota bacterium]|nr:PilN domain-containing protein [Candidatus Paceibacterota bacterium]